MYDHTWVLGSIHVTLLGRLAATSVLVWSQQLFVLATSLLTFVTRLCVYVSMYALATFLKAGLRMLFEYLRVPIFAEVVSGLSYRRFASLDVYVAMYTSAMGMQPQPMVVWNAAYEDNQGIIQYPIQDQWWSMPVWRSMCQLGLNLLDYQVGGIPAPVQATVQGVLTDLALQSL